ncbi:hypothetical protein RI543_000898 [Arxiozyma heterogenica]|uniref:Uncharacterized protein n=1 Tax=Arxiozyma heterogenica TaxID=278026 RepID=A0AAN8A7Z3_9SACH|nr:hypothetical protein RI543_000898 [Kazachstania heterogenica]
MSDLDMAILSTLHKSSFLNFLWKELLKFKWKSVKVHYWIRTASQFSNHGD